MEVWPMAHQLLKTKFHLPEVRADLVRRPRLTNLIDRGLLGRLTLISAPAGAGKSTLVGEWRQSEKGRAHQFVWLSLDEADSDPVRFFTYFASALDGIRPGIGDTALSLFRASNMGAQHSEILTALINEIAEIEEDFVLGLDDYHAITDEQVHEMMATFVEQMPPQMHLLIATRHDPPLPLARLRVRGALTEIRRLDLQFDVSEAALMLAAGVDRALPHAIVADLTERTEGWAAGLHLFGLSIRGRDLSAVELERHVRSFGGGQRFVFDYLAGEIFEQCDESTREFLLKTSLLERVTGPLCNRVTGMVGGDEVISRLAEQNLFLVPLDEEGKWYRYHHLFRDFLRARAEGLDPDIANGVLRRAAAWLEERGMLAEAIQHARAAGDHDTVARLLAANFDEFQRSGHFASMASWVASLPDEMVRKRPRLALMHALALTLSNYDLGVTHERVSWAEEAIRVIEEGGDFDPRDDIDGSVVGSEGLEALKGELLALKFFHAAMELPADEAAEIAGRALKLLPPSKHNRRGMVHLIGGLMRFNIGDTNSALSSLQRGVDEAHQARDPALLVYGLACLGQVSVATGRLEDGRRSYDEAFSVGQDASSEVNWVMCCPHTWLAELLLERGDLEGAVNHVTIAHDFADKSPMMGFTVNMRTTAAQVLQAAGEWEAALEHLNQALRITPGMGHFRPSFLSSVTLNVYCRAGDLESAADVVRERELAPDVAVEFDNEEEMTAYARFLIASGEFGDADQVLARVLEIVRSGGRVQHEIHALALHALARELLGKRALALESLGRATMLGEPGRFNRTFNAEGPIMATLLKALVDAMRRHRSPAETGSPSYLQYLLDESGAGKEAKSVKSDEPQFDSSQGAARTALPEPLSEREFEILALITSGASNQQIAEQLYVTISTVKSHINRTYRKLDVKSRTQAIAKARHLGLV